MEVETPVHPATAEVGIDLGIATFAATSDGVLHPPLNAYRRVAKKKARMQQRLAGMVKYSQNWKKQQRRIAQLDIRTANCRHDFLHKLSTETSKNHAVIVLEDLQAKNMSKSAKGTVDNPGRHVAQKSGLNKAILDQGWGTFRRMVEYKQAWRGGEVVAVNPRYTSQTCPECGHVSKRNRPQQAYDPARSKDEEGQETGDKADRTRQNHEWPTAACLRKGLTDNHSLCAGL